MRTSSSYVEEVQQGSNAESAGLLSKDQIIKIDEKKITYFDDIQQALYAKKDQNVRLTVLRPSNDAINDTIVLDAEVNEYGTIGFSVGISAVEDSSAVETVSYTFLNSITEGTQYGLNTLGDYVSQFKFIFTKKGAGSIGGFATIGNLFPPVWDWQAFWMQTALLSIILAFMNILPIPALDGGHVIFLIYEMITGKEAPQRVLEIAQYVGIFLLLGLMIYANGNDLIRWINGGF